MTIRHLKTFIKVAELNSISKAAEALFVAQPSISQTIKELEECYDVVLFDRVNRKIKLTKDGELLLSKAKEVVSSFTDFEDLASKKDISSKIKVGLSLTFGQFVLPTFMHEVAKLLDKVDPYFYVDKTKELENKILLGDLDFAIIEGDVSSPEINQVKIGTDRLVCVAGLNYPIPDYINLKDIVNYKLLLREKGSASRKILDNALLNIGIKIIEPRMESISNSVILSMVINNNGVAVLPYDTVKYLLDRKDIKEVKLNTDINRNLYLISHKNKKFTKLGKQVYEIVKRLLEK